MVRKERPREEIIRQLRNAFVTSSAQQSKQSLLRPVILRTESTHKEEKVDEIFLAREINSRFELSLADQLAASRAFVQTLLSLGIGVSDLIKQLRPRKMHKLNQKFRR